METNDIVIIGGGISGYVAAIHASHLGAKVVLIEKDKLGGTCLNRGCIPTKTLIRSIEILLDTKRASEFGIDVPNISIDLRKIMARKTSVVTQIVDGVEKLVKLNKINYLKGNGRIVSPHIIKINSQEISAKKIIIATGSEFKIVPIAGTDLAGVLTTDEILNIEEIPQSLIIIGGSHIGVEFASIFNALGTKVTIIEQRPFLLELIDKEIGRRFTEILSKQGILIKIGAEVKSIQKKGELLKVSWNTLANGRNEEVDGQKILMATGRQPYTVGLGLSELGIKMNEKAIIVNEEMETNIEGIYATGDVLGKHMMAHVASYEGEIAVENAMGKPRKADYTAIPTCVFAHPEVAGVGITENEAKINGIAYQISKFPFMACGRAVTMNETIGMVKMICSSESGKILGMHIFGYHASDLIAEGVLAIKMGATAQDVAHTIHAHPTFPEVVFEAAMGQLEGSIHYQRL
jgi:dihydrolipoamide dehydrogenase